MLFRSCFAVLRADGIAVPVASALKAAEIGGLAAEMAVDAFCYSAEFISGIPEGHERSLTEVPIWPGRSALRVKLASGRVTPASERDQLRKINAACITSSSGTTSKAKRIVLSHSTLLERANMRRQTPVIAKHSSLLWLRAMDRFVPNQISGSLVVGAKVIIADSLLIGPLPQLIEEHSVDQIYASPLFYRTLLLEGLTKDDLPGVKYFVNSGSSLPNAVAEAFCARFGHEIVESYGLAEIAPVLVNTSGHISKRGSVGMAVPQREVKLASLNFDADQEAIGEILVKGDGMFDAYYQPWRLRDEVLEDGWFRTGDTARKDADGYYWLIGRVKDVINVGGVKVFPSEVEEVLLSHPAVEEAMVFGVSEARFGEAPHAKLKLKGRGECTERELLRYANERLSVFKALRSVEFVNEIPKTVTGKPRRIG